MNENLQRDIHDIVHSDNVRHKHQSVPEESWTGASQRHIWKRAGKCFTEVTELSLELSSLVPEIWIFFRLPWMCWLTWVMRSWRRSGSTPMATATNSLREWSGCWGGSRVRPTRPVFLEVQRWMTKSGFLALVSAPGVVEDYRGLFSSLFIPVVFFSPPLAPFTLRTCVYVAVSVPVC